MNKSVSSIFKYLAATACVVTTGFYTKLLYIPRNYEDRLEELKVSLLQVVDLEDSNPFENEFRSRWENAYSYEALRAIFYTYVREVRMWLAINILASQRSPQACELFLSTYGYGSSGLQRLARLCCLTTPSEKFVDSMQRSKEQDLYSAPTVVIELLDLLKKCQFSNECFDHITTKIQKQFDDATKLSEESEDRLDDGIPIFSYAKKSPQAILNELLRVISEILDSSDYLAKENLLKEGLVEKLLRLRQSDENVRIVMLDLLSKISCTHDFIWYLLEKDVIYYAASCLKDGQVEMKSISHKILHNVSHRDKIQLNTYLGYQTSESEMSHMNIVFVHGLLGKAHRTWRCNDTCINAEHHTYCWPLDWLPATLNRRRVSPKVVLMTYPTALSSYSTYCLNEEQCLHERAHVLRQNIQSLKLNGPMILVGHSMGGLLLKQIIVQAEQCNDQEFLAAISGICFYSTPHHGSPLAKYATANQLTKKILHPTKEVEELSSNSDYLKELHHDFNNVTEKYPKLRNILSFVETVPTKLFGATEMLIVDKVSANIEHGKSVEIGENHINVNKPVSRSDPAYSEFVNFILNCKHSDD